MKTIELTQGKVTLVDDDVYEWAKEYVWWPLIRKSGLVHVFRKEGRKTVYLHRQILNLSGPLKCDHKNGNGLDNRRDNIRPATSTENSVAFRRKAHGKSSKFRGVSFCKRTKQWRATIYWAGKQKQIGRFSTQEAAALERDRHARNLHGNFAQLNFV